MAIEHVILVDEFDIPIGEMEKLEAHQKGLLHRAFSVFIFNDRNEMLLQKRALNKYHSPGLITNTCCSHPRPNENTHLAAKRRLQEEMGINCELEHKGFFIYKTDNESAGFENGLIENEYDHIFFGTCNAAPKINKNEVDSYEWSSIEQIKTRIKSNPEQFTHWFKLAVEKFF